MCWASRKVNSLVIIGGHFSYLHCKIFGGAGAFSRLKGMGVSAFGGKLLWSEVFRFFQVTGKHKERELQFQNIPRATCAFCGGVLG